MLEPPADKLAVWSPSDEEAWAMRLRRDQRWASRFPTPLMQATTTTVVDRAVHAAAQAVALTGSTARAKRTAISDLDYHVVGVRPSANDLPADVDIYAGKSDALWAKLDAGDDVIHWTLRCGCILADDGILRTAAAKVVDGGLWPDGSRKLARLPELCHLAERLITVGDRDAAQDHVRATLTSAARGLLLIAGVFPLSRSELPAQLEQSRLKGLASALNETIYGEPSLDQLARHVDLLTTGSLARAA
jgi:hypothetical protein